MTTAPADDLDRLMAVMQGAFDPEYGEAWTRRQVEDSLLLGRTHYILVAEDGSVIAPGANESVNAAGFVLSRTGVDEEELLLFAVLPEYRGRGIGSQLLALFTAAARERGAARLLLEMRRGNPAEGLYLRHGFTPIGMRKNYYRTRSGVRVDAITFSISV